MLVFFNWRYSHEGVIGLLFISLLYPFRATTRFFPFSLVSLLNSCLEKAPYECQDTIHALYDTNLFSLCHVAWSAGPMEMVTT
ncbi:hypothetical protein IWX50DRAFT_622713 [Phyllosticta citricarpa]|uniref:Uncharacterized protein n=1 Tax=Phyllosticta citricarpa TaxID=55181 RepID=A0ABR1MK98_9PEZI